MFGLSTLELRLACYGVLLAAIGGWLLYERQHLITEGEARIKAQDASARESQKAEDLKVSKGVVDDLQNRLNLLSSTQPALPPPVLRLCPAAGRMRETHAPAGTQPAVAPLARESAGGMPTGAPGIDIGGKLQDVTRAAQVVAIYREETYDWAVKQSQPTR